MLFYVLFLCKCVLYYCHRVSTQLHLTNISYRIKLANTVATTTAEHPESSVKVIRDIFRLLWHQTNSVHKTAPVKSSSVQSKHTCSFRESQGMRLHRLRSPYSSCRRLPAEQHRWRSDPGDDISHFSMWRHAI